jgi:hypothetical protein
VDNEGRLKAMSALVSIFGTILNAIGHGSSTPSKFVCIIMLVVAFMFAALSINPKTRIGGAFTHGKAGSSPISPAGRVIGLLTALVLFIAGIRGLLT